VLGQEASAIASRALRSIPSPHTFWRNAALASSSEYRMEGATTAAVRRVSPGGSEERGS
jgi:hypothetical protein